jgi:hypothetical protein
MGQYLEIMIGFSKNISSFSDYILYLNKFKIFPFITFKIN